MADIDANSNQTVTKVVSLVVAIVVFALVLVPIVGSMSEEGSGETHTNPNARYNMSYAVGEIPDFSVTFDFNMGEGMIYVNNEVAVSLEDVDTIALIDFLIPLYMDSNVVVSLIEGFMTVIFADDTETVKIIGQSGSVICSDGVITVSMEGGVGSDYVFSAPEWCYYYDAEGEYGSYDDIRVANSGVYIDTETPICVWGIARYDSDSYNMYNENVSILNIDGVDRVSSLISNTYSMDMDGNKVQGISWVMDEFTINEEYLSTDESMGYIIIAPHTVTSGSGPGSGGDSGTVGTLISIIPIFVALGILLAIIGMFYNPTRNQ